MRIEAAAKRIEAPVVRRARKADLSACAQIVNDYIDATEWLPRTKSRAEIAGLFTPDLLTARILLVAEFEGEVCAYLSMSHEGWVSGLYLAPHVRSRGIGAMLIGRAKELQPALLELTVFEPNTGAKRFYEREGFREIPARRDDKTDEGVPTLLMRWRGDE